jgi:DnaJ-class molecular chaperone
MKRSEIVVARWVDCPMCGGLGRLREGECPKCQAGSGAVLQQMGTEEREIMNVELLIDGDPPGDRG